LIATGIPGFSKYPGLLKKTSFCSRT